ncbi:MAG: outer membrane protein assembly factor BamC [Pseudomonas sp.]
MKPVLGALSVVLLGSLSGCGYIFGDTGYFRDRGSDYQTAVIEPRMRVPEGVQSKPLGDLLPVPGQVAASAEPTKYQMPRPQAMMVSADASEFSLQQNGGVRWIQTQRSPAETWPQVRQFWNDYQVPVATESPSLGELQTDWIAFDLSPDNPLVRRMLPAVGQGRRVDGQEQRFRVRVEPGVQSGSSEIYVLHMSRSQGGSLTDWPTNSDNANLERAVLAEMESYLSQGRSADSASLVAEQIGSGARATLDQDGAGNPVLNINSDFNRAWASVGSALNRADVLVTDLNRSSGVYYVDLGQTASSRDERGFFSRLFRRDKPSEEGADERLQVRLTPVSNSVQVTIEKSIDTAADAAEARALLARIRDNLG